MKTDTNCLEVFGKRLKELRISNKISQQELADEIGISKSALCYYENENRAPDIVTLEKLCNYFNVNADYLLGRCNVKTRKSNTKIVCKMTGLSETSVDILKKLTDEKECKLLDTINFLLGQLFDEICYGEGEDYSNFDYKAYGTANFNLNKEYNGSVLSAISRFLGRYSTLDDFILEGCGENYLEMQYRDLLYNQFYLNQVVEAVKRSSIEIAEKQTELVY